MQLGSTKTAFFSSSRRGRPPCLPEKNERGIRWQSGQKKTGVRRQKSDEGHSQAVRGCVKIRIMDEKSLPVVPSSSWEEGLGVVEKNNDITYYKSYVYEMVEPFCLYHPWPHQRKEGTTKWLLTLLWHTLLPRRVEKVSSTQKGAMLQCERSIALYWMEHSF